MSDTGQVQQPQGETDNPDLNKIARWVAEIELYDRETAKWKKQRKRIIKRFKDDRGDTDNLVAGARFNSFWANIKTQMPSMYSRNPKPDIQRRFKDADPIGRVTSDVLERCCSYYTDTDAFYAANRKSVMDFMLVGRGTTWCRYIPHFGDAEELTDSIEDGDQEPIQTIAYEEALTDYVHPDDFGHNICRTPDEIWCGWRIVYMGRAELVKRFKEKGVDIPLDHVQKDISGEKLTDGGQKASIYELWDKDRKCAIWFHKTIPDALDLRPDPLKLENFFPFPVPLLANLANDSCIPTPDYIEYQDQAIELDELTTRISLVTKALKVAGVYDASAEGLGRLLTEGVENKLIPVENFAILAEKGGLANAISFLPIKDIASALLALYQARDKVKEDLHEISGIPDIARGESDANETLGAQEIKTQFALNRISDAQRDVQRFVREEIRLVVDIIAGHFQIETIKKISGVRLFTAQEKAEIKQFQQATQMAQQAQQPPQSGMMPQPPMPPQAMAGLSPDQLETMMIDPSWDEVEALIRNDAMRCFRIDIETDSTIKADEQQEKQSRIEFLKAIGEYMANALPAGQQHPELVPFLLEGLQFLARGFPVGKNMESALNTAIQKLEKIAANPPPRPNPEMAKIQADAQMKQQELQQTGAIEQQKMQSEMQMRQQEAQLDAQVEQAKQASQAQQAQQENELEAQRTQAKMNAEMQIQREKLAGEQQIEQARIAQAERLAQIENDREILKARIAQETAIAVANINASAKADIADEAGAQARDDQIEGAVPDKELHAKIDQLTQAFNSMAQVQDQASRASNDNIDKIHQALTAEKEIVRDPKTNRATGVRVKPNPKAIGKELRN